MLKTALIASGFAMALLAGGLVVSGTGQAQVTEQDPPAATNPDPPRQPPASPDLSVTAPQADIRIDKERGRVHVRAPYSSINVDADGRQLQVRAPFINLEVRW
jgi:hypothetical protein